jgi:soluble cytochrome b562
MIEDIVLEMLVTGVIQEESSMDRIASAGFEGIAQMLLEQKKLMDALEAENRELRRQLNDLRRGIGIAVVIEGKTVQLATDQSVSQAQAALQSLQNLQNQGTQNALQSNPSSQPTISGGYAQNTRQTGGQQTVNLSGDKRDNGSSRGPLADSFLLT